MAKRPNENSQSGSKKSWKKQKTFHVSDRSDLGREEYMQLLESRKQLPIFPSQREITTAVTENDTVIIMGETASGKTTQIPQYLFKRLQPLNGMIAVTQPRRIAAITVATQVAKEVNTSLGTKVGYKVRFKNVTTDRTKIVFMTDGMLVREAIADRLFSAYSIVILDEAHERSLNTDLLLALIKRAQEDRRSGSNPLKVVVMSATLKTEKFSAYFPNSEILTIPGRQHSIEDRWLAKPSEDKYLQTAILLVIKIHLNEAPGDILVFLTGAEEISFAVRRFEKWKKGFPGIVPLPIFGSLSQAEQLKVFQPVEAGQRKVIFATNIAETSLTIPGIKYVVDCGCAKVKYHVTNNIMDILQVRKISRQQAAQRRGRAGRESSGICYHAYTKSEFLKFREEPVPEIQRSNMMNMMLEMLAMGITDPENFDFLDRPSRENMTSSLRDLVQLGAAENPREGGGYKVTEMGRKMAQFPLDPRFSKILLMSESLKCTVEVVAILAMLSVPNIFAAGPGQERWDHQRYDKLVSLNGDHETLLKIYREFVKNKKSEIWCARHRLDFHSLKNAFDIRKQLVEICTKIKIPLNSCGTNLDVVGLCFLHGLYKNVAKREKDTYVTLENKQQVFIHPNSVMFNRTTPYILYTELVHTTKHYMKNVCSLYSTWFKKVEPNYFQNKI